MLQKQADIGRILSRRFCSNIAHVHVQEYREHIATTQNLSNYSCSPTESKQVSALIAVIDPIQRTF